MLDQARVSDLLVDWQDRRDRGQGVSPEELCACCPELAAALREKVLALTAMEDFMGLSDTPGGPPGLPAPNVGTPLPPPEKGQLTLSRAAPVTAPETVATPPG